jgi:hypothetical protein
VTSKNWGGGVFWCGWGWAGFESHGVIKTGVNWGWYVWGRRQGIRGWVDD